MRIGGGWRIAVFALVGLPTLGLAQPGRPQLVAQLGHAGFVTAAAFSPDGKWAATVCDDGAALLWDATGGQELRRFEGRVAPGFAIAFSPDGKGVLTGGDGAAVLWDARTGRKLRPFSGHKGFVRSVAFSRDGTRVLTGGDDRTARLWDARTGQELKRLTGHTNVVVSVAFAPDGTRVLTGGADGTARLWDVRTGQELKRLMGGVTPVLSVAFGPDGTRVLTSSGPAAVLWDAGRGTELRRFTGHAGSVRAVAFTPDGKGVLTGGQDRTVRLWDAERGTELRRSGEQINAVTAVAVAPDGRRVLTGGDRAVRVWDAQTGKGLEPFAGRVGFVHSVAFAPDGTRLLAGGETAAVLWDAERGNELRRLKGHTGAVRSVAFAPDGSRALTGSNDQTARLWDARTGQELKRFAGHTDTVLAVAFSPDGMQVLTGSHDRTARLWDARTGLELKRFAGHAGPVLSVAFAPDGTRVLTGSHDRTARLWDARTGQELKRFGEHAALVRSVAFAPDGKRVLAAGGPVAVLWDASRGTVLRRFEGHTDYVLAVAFSSDGKRVLTGGIWDKTVVLWDAETGRELQRFAGHAGLIGSVALSPDGRHAVSGSYDGSARLWATDTGKELCRLHSFRDGAWAVVDPHGRYDASNGGDVPGLHWVVESEPVSLDQLKERYYDPGLLAKHLGLNKEPLRAVQAFANPALFPEVRVTGPTAADPTVRVSLTNRGGGIGRVVVKVNGKELTADARPRGADPDAANLVLPPIDLTNDPRLKPGEENVVEVQAYSAGQFSFMRSRGFEVRYVHRGRANTELPDVWVVVVGVSKYAGDALNLRYAAKDAEDIARAVEVASGGLFTRDRVRLTVLSSERKEPAAQPTRANVVRALEAARKAKPHDILIVYLAGHGVSEGGPEGDYYFLTADARTAQLTDPAVRDRVALSGRELTELLRQVPAAKQVLILDTCAAGRAVDRLTDKREVPAGQVRALERVKDRTGTHVLAGCAADAVSYEASRFAQGVLTYSLLLGMQGAALLQGDQVDVVTLFNFATDRVPELARDIGGVQRPVVASPKGASFTIGRVTPEDQPRIPVRLARPLVLRSGFQEEESFDDVLGLGRRVDERLRSASARGDGGLVFVDAREMPDAYRLTGRYRVEDKKVTVTVNLARGKEKAPRFTVAGDEAKPDELAAKIAAEVEKRLAAAEAK